MFLITRVERVRARDERSECWYDIRVVAGDKVMVFPAEVRLGRRGVQLDWSDEFQDLLMHHQADFTLVRRLLYEMYSGVPVALPVSVGK